MFGRSNGATEGRAGFVCGVINNEGRWLDFFELTWVRWALQLVKKWYSISYVNAFVAYNGSGIVPFARESGLSASNVLWIWADAGILSCSGQFLRKIIHHCWRLRCMIKLKLADKVIYEASLALSSVLRIGSNIYCSAQFSSLTEILIQYCIQR